MSGAGDESTPKERSGAEWNRRPVADRRTWLTVARKDFADAGRSWQLYVLGAVFTTAMTVTGLGPVLGAMARNAENPTYVFHDGLVSMAGSTGFVVAIVGLLIGHTAIAGQFERGSLRTLLTFPVSRRDVVLGTFVGRTAVLWTTLVVGLVVAAVPMALLYDDLNVLTYAVFSGTILAFGACFVAMAVGISAASRTRGGALGWTMSAFALTTLLWDMILWLQQIVTDVSPVRYMGEPDRAPGWYVFLDRAQPSTAWRNVVSNWVVPVFPDAALGQSRHRPSLTTQGPEPFYLEPWALALVLFAWGAVPLAVGYWRFRSLDVD